MHQAMRGATAPARPVHHSMLTTLTPLQIALADTYAIRRSWCDRRQRFRSLFSGVESCGLRRFWRQYDSASLIGGEAPARDATRPVGSPISDPAPSPARSCRLMSHPRSLPSRSWRAVGAQPANGMAGLTTTTYRVWADLARGEGRDAEERSRAIFFKGGPLASTPAPGGSALWRRDGRVVMEADRAQRPAYA